MDYGSPPMARSTVLLGGALLVAACGNRAKPTDAAASSSPPAAPASASASARPRDPGAPAVTSANPLGLPPAKINLDAGKRIFTFSDRMMAAARPGETMILGTAIVTGLDGDDLIVEGRNGPPHKVHPAYVIPVPDAPHIRPGDAVLTEHGGLLRHAVVVRFVKDKVLVRFVGDEPRTQEAQLPGGSGAPTHEGASKAARFVRQVEGFAPGNYAALREDDGWSHVMLVSSSGEGEAKRWFVLGYASAAKVVSERDLRPIPLKYKPKLHAVVWAESAGKMRRATVERIDDPGLYTVKFERAGRPVTVGWGALMAPIGE